MRTRCAPPSRTFLIRLVVGLTLWIGVGLPLWADDANRVGWLDVRGSWRMQIGDDPAWASPDRNDRAWRIVQLPATWDALGLVGIDGPLWLRTSIRLPAGLRGLLPTGSSLALLIDATHYGTYDVYAGGTLIGGHGSTHPQLTTPAVRVIAVPRQAISADGTLHLALRYNRFRAAADAWRTASGPVGAALWVGDAEQLRAHVARQVQAREQAARPQVFLALLLTLLLGAALLGALRDDVDRWSLPMTAAIGAAGVLLTTPWATRWIANDTLIYVLIALAVYALGILAVERYGRRYGGTITPAMRAHQLTGAVLAATSALFPALFWHPLPRALRVVWLLALATWLGTHLVRHARVRGDARPLLMAIAALTLGLGLDLGQSGWLLGTGELPIYGLSLFALLTAMLDGRSARAAAPGASAGDDAAAAADDAPSAGDLQQRLEQMVEDQTRELAAANTRLEAQIAERRMAEEAMRMLERAVEQSADGIVVTDLYGHMQFTNEAWASMHGYEVLELLAYELSLFHTHEQMHEAVQPFLDQVRSEGTAEAELDHRRRDGTNFPTWTSATLLRDADEQPIGFVIMARDITERRRLDREQRRLAERVRQTQRLESLSALAGGVAHDYNNLLTGIFNDAALALEALRALPARDGVVSDGGEDGAVARAIEHVEQIETAGESAARLTDQLFDYAGLQSLRRGPLDLNALVAELVASPPKPGTELHAYYGDDLPTINADTRMIGQAVSALIRNAAEATTPDDPSVSVVTGRVREATADDLKSTMLEGHPPPGDYVYIEIGDAGEGVPDDLQGRIVEPFFTTKISGRGLGLAMVMGVVRAHGGTLTLRSRVGRGTVVKLWLPLTGADEALADEPDDAGRVAGGWQARGTVLVVDDEAMMRRVIAAMLEQLGLTVLSASSGAEALAHYRGRGDGEAPIRAVLLDWTMPGMDGAQTFHALRALDVEVPVILMSGYSEAQVRTALGHADVTAGFLKKPFRADDLVRALQRVLEVDGAMATAEA
ncbi:MAG: response regulator [Acidobacteriota bacterium]